MPSKETILDDEELKRIEKQFDPEGTVDLQALMGEIHPKKWHHEWGWSESQLQYVGMAQMGLVMGFLCYILAVWIPKPAWAIPVGIVILFMILGLWNFGVKYQAAMDAKYTFIGGTFYMGGKPDCGMQQLRIWYPTVRAETDPDVKPVNIQKVRQYVNSLAEDFAKTIAEQRQTLRSLGVQVPEPLPDAEQRQQIHPLGHILSHPKPERSLSASLVGWVANWWPIFLLIGILGFIASALLIYMAFLFYPLAIWNYLPIVAGSIITTVLALWLKHRKNREIKGETS